MWLGLKIISIKIQAFWFFSSDQVVTWEWLDHFFEFWPFWAYYSLLLRLILWKGSHTAPDILVNLKNFANYQLSASNYKRFSQSKYHTSVIHTVIQFPPSIYFWINYWTFTLFFRANSRTILPFAKSLWVSTSLLPTKPSCHSTKDTKSKI